jgi:nucleoid DNA-binding protein
MNVIQHLRNLLLQQNSVILPGFGEFSTREKPAAAHPSGNFSPAAKTLVFNSSSKANDYVLAKYIAEKEEVGISNGNDMIRELVEEILQTLRENHSLTIPQIGTFTLQGDDAPISFVPDNTTNFQVSSFGLENFRLTPKEQPSTQPAVEEPIALDPVPVLSDQSSPVPNPPMKKQKKRNRLWIWLILLTLLITAAISVAMLFPDKTNEYWDVIREKISPTETVESNQEIVSESDEPEPLIPEVDSQHVATSPNMDSEMKSENSEQQLANTKPAPIPSGSDQIVIIAGCFGEKANAERMMDRLKQLGFSGAALDGKTTSGLFRVAAGYYPTHEAATRALRKAEEENKLKNAWIGKRQLP